MPGTRRVGSRRMFGARASGPRRQTEWISVVAPWVTQSGGEQLLASFQQAALSLIVPFTITRTVGILGWAFDEDFILDQDVFGAFGCAVVRESARGQGGASIPGALANAGDDIWWTHQFFSGFAESVGGIEADIVTSQQVVIDSRAQRKVVDGDALIFTSELDSTSDDVEICLGLRILCKLH